MLAVLAAFAPAPAEKVAPKPATRKLLVPACQEDVPKALQPFVARLLSAEQKQVDPASVKPAGGAVGV